jgi:hypothetical protein
MHDPRERCDARAGRQRRVPVLGLLCLAGVRRRDAVDGQQHTGTTYSPGHSASREYRDAAVLAEQFPAGWKATRYVNPANLL